MRCFVALMLAACLSAQTVITTGGTSVVSSCSRRSVVLYRSSSAVSYSSRTNTILTAPTGIQNGDLLLVFFTIGGATPPTPTAPSGFASAVGFPKTVTDGSFTLVNYCWYKIASGESGDYAITHAASSSQAYIGAYKGANAVAPLSPNPTLATGIGTTSTATGLTTAADGSTVIFVSQDWNDFSSSITTPAGAINLGFTTRLNGAIAAGVLYVADGVMETSGGTGDQSVVNNSSESDPWSAYLIAIQP